MESPEVCITGTINFKDRQSELARPAATAALLPAAVVAEEATEIW
jgi:hypothetical protein